MKDEELTQFFLKQQLDHEGHALCTGAMYPGLYRFTTTHGWLKYNGKFWDGEGAEQSAERAITATLTKRREIFAGIEEFKKARLCAGWRQNVTGTKAQFAKMADVFTNISEFDRSKDLINCRNGVLDLRTGEIVPHEPNQLFTYCINAEYSAFDATQAGFWVDFLKSCGLDDEMIDYMQIALGYSLTGHTSEEVLFYIVGMTRSGKGTTMETLNHILGDLSSGVNMETLTAKRYGDTSYFDLAPLKNKRFITSSETQRNGQLNAAFIKKITGGDDIYCSFKRKDHFKYRPQFKVWITSNFEVNTDVDDDAAWGRLRVIHFPNTFLGKEDKGLKQRLRRQESLNCIFSWIVQGAIKWYAIREQGMPLPQQIVDKTAEHRQALDSVAQFIEQCCRLDEYAFSIGGALHSQYKTWCEDEGYFPVGRKRFTQSLAAKGIIGDSRRVGAKTQRGYAGIEFLYEV
jgi:putative DNA primase/helicase